MLPLREAHRGKQRRGKGKKQKCYLEELEVLFCVAGAREKQKMLPPRRGARGAGGAKVKKHKITGGLRGTSTRARLGIYDEKRKRYI
jgi:hypothetical protein